MATATRELLEQAYTAFYLGCGAALSELQSFGVPEDVLWAFGQWTEEAWGALLDIIQTYNLDPVNVGYAVANLLPASSFYHTTLSQLSPVAKNMCLGAIQNDFKAMALWTTVERSFPHLAELPNIREILTEYAYFMHRYSPLGNQVPEFVSKFFWPSEEEMIRYTTRARYLPPWERAYRAVYLATGALLYCIHDELQHTFSQHILRGLLEEFSGKLYDHFVGVNHLERITSGEEAALQASGIYIENKMQNTYLKGINLIDALYYAFWMGTVYSEEIDPEYLEIYYTWLAEPAKRFFNDYEEMFKKACEGAATFAPQWQVPKVLDIKRPVSETPPEPTPSPLQEEKPLPTPQETEKPAPPEETKTEEKPPEETQTSSGHGIIIRRQIEPEERKPEEKPELGRPFGIENLAEYFAPTTKRLEGYQRYIMFGSLDPDSAQKILGLFLLPLWQKRDLLPGYLHSFSDFLDKVVTAWYYVKGNETLFPFDFMNAGLWQAVWDIVFRK